VKRTVIYSPGGTVWRVHPAVNGRLVGELRDTENRRVSFFAIAFPEGKPLWEGFTVDEQWWNGIDRVEGDLLFIHGFVSPDMPMHRGITVVDIPTGKQLWSQPLWTLDVVRGRTLRVLTDGRDHEPTILVDARTGEGSLASRNSMRGAGESGGQVYRIPSRSPRSAVAHIRRVRW
jgi:hypothetical protein